jgi:RNA polymerase sigma factor (sigma-70 family)
MSGDTTAELEELILRLRAGDPAARQELINRVYPRLRRLAGKLLGESFPRLKGRPAWQSTSDVANEASLRLYQALAEVQPATVQDFFRLAACRVRWILLDLARKPALPLDQGPPPEGPDLPGPAGAPDSDVAPRSAAWVRLHEQVEQLPAEERAVVDLLFYAALTEAEAAEVLRVSARTVRRRWLRAKLKLFEALRLAGPDWEAFFGGEGREG